MINSIELLKKHIIYIEEDIRYHEVLLTQYREYVKRCRFTISEKTEELKELYSSLELLQSHRKESGSWSGIKNTEG